MARWRRRPRRRYCHAPDELSGSIQNPNTSRICARPSSESDGVMLRCVAKGGVVLATLTAIGLGVYFIGFGLDEADKLASVIGAFIGLAGLATAVYGTVRDRRHGPSAQQSSAPGNTPGTVHNEIHGGTHYGPVIQGRDLDHVVFVSPAVPATPPDHPDRSTEE